MRLQPIVTACVLAGITLLLYAFHVSVPPLTPQETVFNTQAQSIAGTAPRLFFHVQDDRWVQPLAVYANAAVRVAGGDDMSGRLASVLAGAIDVALVFLVAQVMTGRTWIGVVAAIVLMFSPAHWALAQRGTDAIFPAPLILFWLRSVLVFFQRDSLRTLAAGALALGFNAYSHPAAPLTASFLWLLMLIVARRRNLTRLLMATLAFAAAWVPAAAWFVLHPDLYPDTYGRWVIFAAHIRNPLDLMRAFINPNTLGTRASMYWGFWDPSWLFFSTPASAAPLLLAAAPLIAIGVYRCIKHLEHTTAAMLIGTGLLTPLAGATFGVSHYMADAAAVLPILALVAAIGADQLIALVSRRRALPNDETMAAVEGWHADDGPPQS